MLNPKRWHEKIKKYKEQKIAKQEKKLKQLEAEIELLKKEEKRLRRLREALEEKRKLKESIREHRQAIQQLRPKLLNVDKRKLLKIFVRELIGTGGKD